MEYDDNNVIKGGSLMAAAQRQYDLYCQIVDMKSYNSTLNTRISKF